MPATRVNPLPYVANDSSKVASQVWQTSQPSHWFELLSLQQPGSLPSISSELCKYDEVTDRFSLGLAPHADNASMHNILQPFDRRIQWRHHSIESGFMKVRSGMEKLKNCDCFSECTSEPDLPLRIHSILSLLESQETLTVAMMHACAFTTVQMDYPELVRLPATPPLEAQWSPRWEIDSLDSLDSL